MNLQKRIDKDYNDAIGRANAFYTIKTNEMGQRIKQASYDAIKIIAGHIAILPEMDASTARRLGVFRSIERDLDNLFDTLSNDVNQIRRKARASFNLYGKVLASYVARKASPPWVKVNLDLNKQYKPKDDWDFKTHYYFKNMSDRIMREVTLGVTNQESLTATLTRVRDLFKTKSRAKESEDNPFTKKARSMNLLNDQESIVDEASLDPNVTVHEGFYTIEDVEALHEDMRFVMGDEYRQYRPWFSDEVKRRNADLRAFEVNLQSDMVEALHQGVIQVGDENMGIQDFIWQVEHPQPKCDECCDRDEMLMSEIEDQIHDQYGKQPPPLHPNCRCRIIPKIKEDWADSKLKDAGFEWDPYDGRTFNPTSGQKELGFTDMSIDDYFKSIGR